MRHLFVCSVLLLFGVGNGAYAQQAAPPPSAAAASASADAADTYKLIEGTDVSLQFAQDVSSATAFEDDPVALTLVNDLKVGAVVVVKAGARAFGVITKAQKAGILGKAGQLSMRLDYLKAGDVRVKLRGSKGRDDKMTGTESSTMLSRPIELVKHGKNVEITKGQPLQAFVGEDVVLGPAI
jgi:hypothetical protein